MLLLTRKETESTYIILPDGVEIKVTLCCIQGKNQVKLGFEAPPYVKILREEVRNRKDPPPYV